MTLTVESVVDPIHWYAALERAVDECEKRNSGDHPSGKVLSELVQRIADGKCVCLIVVDETTGKPRIESVCGLVVMEFEEDTLTKQYRAVLTVGWGDPKYRSKQGDVLFGAVDSVAKGAGCEKVWLYAERNDKAYERFIKRWGFEKSKVVFEKKARLT
jgi:hypothetical protein